VPSVPLRFLSLLLLICCQFVLPYRIGRKRASTGAQIPRRNRYLGAMSLIVVQTMVVLIIGLANSLKMLGSRHIELNVSLFAAGFLILNMCFIDPVEWKYTSPEIKNRILNFLPHNSRERLAWVPVSLVISISEELAYRAVFFGLLYSLTRSYWGAAIISSVLFALAHRKYGLTAVGVMLFVGLGLQWCVYLSGGLYVSIGIHFLHNLINGLVYGWGLRDGPEAGMSPALDRGPAMAQSFAGERQNGKGSL